MSSLPIGVNQVEIERGLTTSSTAVFVPFTTQELFQGGEALYYGLNALSNNMIMVDRKRLKNPNGLILGTPGSGKSFSAKREMTNAFLITRMTSSSSATPKPSISPCAEARRSGYPHFAGQHGLHQSAGHQHELLRRGKPADAEIRLYPLHV